MRQLCSLELQIFNSNDLPSFFDPSTSDLLQQRFAYFLDLCTPDLLQQRFAYFFDPSIYVVTLYEIVGGSDLPQSRELSPRFACRQQK